MKSFPIKIYLYCNYYKYPKDMDMFKYIPYSDSKYYFTLPSQLRPILSLVGTSGNDNFIAVT